jgi:hypothetical protein
LPTLQSDNGWWDSEAHHTEAQNSKPVTIQYHSMVRTAKGWLNPAHQKETRGKAHMPRSTVKVNSHLPKLKDA